MADEQKRFGSHEELGRWLQSRHPEYEGMDPSELGRQAEPQLAGQGVTVIQEYGQISPLETLKNFPGDLVDTGLENVEGIAEAVSSPIQTGRALFNLTAGGLAEMGRASAVAPVVPGQAQLMQLLGRGLEATSRAIGAGSEGWWIGHQPPDPTFGIADDDNRAMARGFGRQVASTLEPGAIEKRPANALATIMDVLPVGPGHLTRTRLLRTLGSATPSRMMTPRNVTAAARGVSSKVVDKVKQSAKSGLLNKLSRPVRDVASDLRIGDRRLRREAGSTIVGITTNRAQEWVNQILSRTKDRGAAFTDFFREARQGFPGADKISGKSVKAPEARARLADRIQREALGAMDDLQRKMTTAYDRGTAQFFPRGTAVGRLLPTEDLTAAVTRSLQSIGVEVIPKKGRRRLRLNFRSGDVTPLGPARQVLANEVAGLLRAMENGHLPAKELHRRRKLIDDAISTMRADSEISDVARHALVDVRKQIAGHLESHMGPEYVRVMREYRDMTVFRDELIDNVRIRPGQVGTDGNISGGTQAQVLRGMESAVGDDLLSVTRLQALERLEKVTGRRGLVDMQLAAMSQAWAGGGLIVRNELAQLGRDVLKATVGGGAAGGGIGALIGGGGGAAIGATAGAVFSGLSASVLFSPRMMSEAMLKLSGSGGRMGNFTVTQLASMQTRFRKVADQMNRLDAMTGGELRARATREGWNVTQLMERLEVQQEEGE